MPLFHGFIDSHAHLTFENIFSDVDNVMQRAKNANVTHVVNICTDKKSLERGFSLSKKYSNIVNAAATTPHDVEKDGEADFSFFEEHANQRNIAAIGETGLDYFYKHASAEIQKKYFRLYIRLAKKTGLPLIIHCREAFFDLFAIMDEEKVSSPVILHCFTGPYKEAQEVINRGWYISFSGIVTFPKSDSLRDVAKKIPLNKLLIETDTPYLAPQKYRGKTNEPAYIVETAKTIASLKSISLEEIQKATCKNACNLFFTKE